MVGQRNGPLQTLFDMFDILDSPTNKIEKPKMSYNSNRIPNLTSTYLNRPQPEGQGCYEKCND